MKDTRQFIEQVLKSEREQKNQLIKEYEGKGEAALKEIATQIKNLGGLRDENNPEHSAISSVLNDMIRKIGGTGIGKVGEAITIQDLKRVASMDSFDETRASKQGTDILGNVNENGTVCGSVVCCLSKGEVEPPSDMHGILFIKYGESIEEVRYKIREELENAGYKIKQQ